MKTANKVIKQEYDKWKRSLFRPSKIITDAKVTDQNPKLTTGIPGHIAPPNSPVTPK